MALRRALEAGVLVRLSGSKLGEEVLTRASSVVSLHSCPLQRRLWSLYRRHARSWVLKAECLGPSFHL